ncbi:MAG: hypothetical protein WBA74_27510, partial [Cyclobacteriaceae bacterium]
MKNLCDLINSFTNEEAELIVKHYLLKRNSYSKRLKLFNMIRHEDITDDCTAANRLYQKKPNAAFSQLKKRLKEDVLDLMLVFNLQDDQLNGYFEAEMLASKQILQGKILISRGLTGTGMILIKKAFKLAGEYEAFEVQTLAYEALKNYSDSIPQTGEFQDMELQFSRNVDILYDIINLRMDHIQNIHQDGDILTSDLISVNGCDKTSVKSSRLHFQYTIKKMEEFLTAKQYKKAREAAEEILPLLDHENQVLTRRQKGDYYYLFSSTLMLLSFNKEAVFYAQKAAGYFGPSYNKRIKTFSLIYKGLFYTQDTEAAHNYMKQFLDRFREIHPTHQNEIELFNAWYAFDKKDYVGSIKGLNNCFKLSTNNSEISLNGKLLELLNLLMMKDNGWFDYKLESFRKYISNNSHLNCISRFSLVYKIFTHIKQLRNKEDASLKAKFRDSLKMLAERDKPYTWNPLGYELIPLSEVVTVERF